MKWQVTAVRGVDKQLRNLPKKIGVLYALLIEDLVQEGPKPFGWDVAALKGRRNAYRIRLTREYRVIIEVLSPNIIVVTVAHRKDVYR